MSLKSLAKKALGKFGYSVSRASENSLPVYHAMITAILAYRQDAKVVIVGANDGVTNDPFFPMAQRFSHKTDILLVEPQKSLLPILQENYRFHPRTRLLNKAIGKPGQINLYAVRSEYWNKLKIPYARERNWPEYRAPTGITSTDRDAVLAWVSRYLPAGSDAALTVEELDVPSVDLRTALSETEMTYPIDILQVDAEGADDEVLYACNLEITKPALIRFEIAGGLEVERLDALVNYLARLGYDTFPDGEDAVSLRVGA